MYIAWLTQNNILTVAILKPSYKNCIIYQFIQYQHLRQLLSERVQNVGDTANQEFYSRLSLQPLYRVLINLKTTSIALIVLGRCKGNNFSLRVPDPYSLKVSQVKVFTSLAYNILTYQYTFFINNV